MSVATESEELFESHCRLKGVFYRKIPVSTTPQPDYELALRKVHIFAEIKQMNPNHKDIATGNQADDEEQRLRVAPVSRVRGMIADAYPQLKPYSKIGKPCLLVAYNNAGMNNRIDEFTVTKSMFGAPSMYFALDATGVIRMKGMGFAGGRKLTRNTCTALSGLAVLEQSQDFRITSLNVYHNPYALNPLDPIWLSALADSQYIYEDPHDQRNARLTPKLVRIVSRAPG